MAYLLSTGTRPGLFVISVNCICYRETIWKEPVRARQCLRTWQRQAFAGRKGCWGDKGSQAPSLRGAIIAMWASLNHFSEPFVLINSVRIPDWGEGNSELPVCSRVLPLVVYSIFMEGGPCDKGTVQWSHYWSRCANHLEGKIWQKIWIGQLRYQIETGNLPAQWLQGQFGKRAAFQ